MLDAHNIMMRSKQSGKEQAAELLLFLILFIYFDSGSWMFTEDMSHTECQKKPDEFLLN